MGVNLDLDPFAAACDDGENGATRCGEPHVVLQLSHVLLGCSFLGEGPGQHELGFEDRAGLLDGPIQRRRHPFVHGMTNTLLDVLHRESARALIPGAVQDFRHSPELDNQTVREILRLCFAALFAPKSDQALLIIPHDDAGIRAANEMPSVVWVESDDVIGRVRAIRLNRCHRYLLRKNKRLHMPHCPKPRIREARYRRYDRC